MKRGSTYFLRGVILLIGISVLALTLYAIFSTTGREPNPPYSEIAYLRPMLWSIFAAAIPFFIALYQGLKLLGYIDKNKAFSELSLTALRNIKYCAIAMSIFFMFGLPLVYQVADIDDAPGLVVIGMVFAGAPLVVATFAGVLQKLFQNGLDLKSENDLTV